jgi:COMPASS component SWD1
MIASTTSQGTVLVWHYPSPERWGAFAGGFEEVDENVAYEEREDEFDIVSCPGVLRTVRADDLLQEDESELERRKKIEEEQFVDIDTLDDLPNPTSTGGTALAPPHQLHARLQALSSSRPDSRLGTPAPAPGTPNGLVVGSLGAAGTPVANAEGGVDEDAAWALDEPDDDLPGWTLKVVIEATPEY